MNILIAAVALAAAQAPSAPADHSQHDATQHAQHQQKGGEAKHDCEKCCKEANGKMECQMMKGHGTKQGAEADHQKGHSGH